MLPSTQRGGAEEYALTIASAAAQAGWQVSVAFPQTDGTASLQQDFREINIPYYPLAIADMRAQYVGASLLRLSRTIALLLRLKPDVVLMVLPFPSFAFSSLIACGLLSVPTALVFQLVPAKISLSQGRLRAYTWARARHQTWIAVSAHNRALIGESFRMPPEDVQCIYNGIPLPPASSDKDDTLALRLQVRQALKIPDSSTILLTVARLHPQKGHNYLVPIIPTLHQAFPQVKFIWVGEGERQDILRQQVMDQGMTAQVLFLGHRSDIPRLLKAADLFIFPTYFEGMPFAILEAMAYGLPIVASATGGIPEIITHQQEGLLCRTGDSHALSETILWALGHPKAMRKMASHAQQRVQAFSRKAMIQKTLGVLNELGNGQ